MADPAHRAVLRSDGDRAHRGSSPRPMMSATGPVYPDSVRNAAPQRMDETLNEPAPELLGLVAPGAARAPCPGRHRELDRSHAGRNPRNPKGACEEVVEPVSALAMGHGREVLDAELAEGEAKAVEPAGGNDGGSPERDPATRLVVCASGGMVKVTGASRVIAMIVPASIESPPLARRRNRG